MLTTRFAPERGSSFKRALWELPLGTMVEADGPSGDSVVESPEVDHVFIAGGIGITPYRAILLDRHYVLAPEQITEQVIRTVIPDPSRPMCYVSGPAPMVEAVGPMVAAMGIPAAHVKQDFFPRYVWP